MALLRSRGSRNKQIVPLGVLVTTVELTHGVYSSCICIRMPACVSRKSSSLEALCSWAGICRGGCCTGETSGLVPIWYEGPGKQPTPVKTSWYSFGRYSFVTGKWCGLPRASNSLGDWLVDLLLLSMATAQLSFRRFKLCADMLPVMGGPSTSTTSTWITLGFGLLGRLMYTWQDPKFGISVPPYAVSFMAGFCRFMTLDPSWLYRDVRMILISAPESILHKTRVCFPSGLTARETSKRAFSLKEMAWTLLVKSVRLIGPRKVWSLGPGTDSLAPLFVA